MASQLSTPELPVDPTCQACIELLLAYVAAGNEVVEIKRRLAPNHRMARHELAPALLDLARAKEAEAHNRLLQYQQQHQCRCQCPNRSSRM